MTNYEKMELMSKVEEAATELNFMPKIIETLIDDLHLDKADLTKEEREAIAWGSEKINSVLSMAQLTIINFLDRIDEIAKAPVEEDK